MNHLDSITHRQRSSRVRDAIFAALIVLAGAVSIQSVSTAVHAASPVAHR